MTTSKQRGTLLIADLSGYTEYLVLAEIEQASAIVGDLIQTVVESFASAFVVNRVEGDAVFAWAPEGTVGAVALLDVIDGTYAQFRHRAVAVHQSTSCGCAACGLVPNLDLEFVAHHGEFVRLPISGREELSGRDVIIAHRLLKNDLGRDGPDSGFALVTAACAAALGIEVIPGATRHVQAYRHIGDVETWVLDLHRRWTDADRWRPPGDPLVRIDATLEAEPPIAWAALAPGRSEGCVTDRLDRLGEILEWRPYRRYVVRAVDDGTSAVHCASFEPSDDGTDVSLTWYLGAETADARALAARLRSHTEAALVEKGFIHRGERGTAPATDSP